MICPQCGEVTPPGPLRADGPVSEDASAASAGQARAVGKRAIRALGRFFSTAGRQ